MSDVAAVETSTGHDRVDLWPVVAVVVAVAVGTLISVGQAAVGAGLVAVVVLAAVHRHHPRGILAIALVLPLLPVLRGVPMSVVLIGRSVYFSDLLLPLSLALACLDTRVPRLRRLGSDAVPYVGVLVIGTAVGLLHASSTSFIIRDLRGPLYVLVAFAATVLLFRDEDRRVVFRVVAGVLWAAAVLVLVESFSGVHLLAGRVEDVGRVEGALSDQVLGATRFLVAPKDLALLCCCAGLALLLRADPSRVWWRLVPAIIAPSVLLVFFSFSRRAVLALAVATLLVLVVTRLSRVVVRVLVLAPVLVAVVAVLALSPVSSDSYVSRQAAAFSDRVLAGLGSDARSQDAGIAFRALENQKATERVMEAPVLGLGLGAAYRPDLPGQPFEGAERAYGRTYVHNFYLWIAVKVGLLGLLALALFVLRPLLAALRVTARSTDVRDQAFVAVAAGVVGLCAVNWVSPIFNEPATAVVLGSALGVLRLRANETSPADAPVGATAGRHVRRDPDQVAG